LNTGFNNFSFAGGKNGHPEKMDSPKKCHRKTKADVLQVVL